MITSNDRPLCTNFFFINGGRWLQNCDNAEYAKFAGLAGHVRRNMKMSGDGV